MRAPGKTPLVTPGRLARVRPPGRDQSSLTGQALEYDLRDTADKTTVSQIVQRISETPTPPGSVTYVLDMPTEFGVSGSPATNGGTFVVVWIPENANYGLWGPVSGSPALPGFRRQINDDLPFRSRIHIEPTAFGGTVNIDASLSSQFSLLANANFTLNAPTNALDGQKITIRITQDGTGGRVMTLNPLYRFSTYLTSAFVVLSTAPGATDYLGLERNDDTDAFDIVAFVPGVS